MDETVLKKALQFRRKAEECSEIARMMSLDRDRLEMEGLAQQWRELADRLEKEGD